MNDGLEADRAAGHCWVCSEGGKLLSCAGCTAQVHRGCAGLSTNPQVQLIPAALIKKTMSLTSLNPHRQIERLCEFGVTFSVQ